MTVTPVPLPVNVFSGVNVTVPSGATVYVPSPGIVLVVDPSSKIAGTSSSIGTSGLPWCKMLVCRFVLYLGCLLFQLVFPSGVTGVTVGGVFSCYWGTILIYTFSFLRLYLLP